MRARLFLVLPCFLLGSALARAHDLDGKAVVRPLGLIQVEAWFETGEAAAQARVEVHRGDSLFLGGRMSKEGTFLFRYSDVQPLRIVVNAGAGHRTEIKVGPEELTRGGVATAMFYLSSSPLLTAPLLVPPLAEALPAAAPIVERAPKASMTGLMIGVTVLVMIAAGGMILARSRASGGRQPPVE